MYNLEYHLVIWPNGFRISNICNPTTASISHHIPFKRHVWQPGLGSPWKVWPGEPHFQVKVPVKMRLLWLSLVLSLVLSLAERLYPVVREDDGKKIVACWYFQSDFSPFAFLVLCDFLFRFHCNGFWLCHHTIFTYFYVSTIIHLSCLKCRYFCIFPPW